MNKGRWIIALIFAVSVHGLFFLLQFSEPEVVQPKPLAIQRIAVSLGEKRTVKKTVQKQVQKETPKKTVISKPKPQVLPKKQVTPKPQAPTPKPQKKMVQEVVPTPVIVDEVAADPITPPVVTEPLVASKASLETAALIKQATPLYQINPPPKYPRIARRRGLQGVVVVEVLVNVFGKVEELHLFNSSGHSILDKAALRAVREWYFSIGTVGGKPEPMWVKVPVRFQLL